MSNVNFVLWKGGGGGGAGSRNIACMPGCRFNVLNVQNYRNIFIIGREKSLKVHFALIYFLGFETHCLIGR